MPLDGDHSVVQRIFPSHIQLDEHDAAGRPFHVRRGRLALFDPQPEQSASLGRRRQRQRAVQTVGGRVRTGVRFVTGEHPETGSRQPVAQLQPDGRLARRDQHGSERGSLINSLPVHFPQ